MHGFKSFVRKTEIPFTPGINVILGPNGSGKSNLSDALCFVLGRLSVKSMRASKAKNLIFMGTKAVAPAKEAMVEIVFDNSNRTFSIDKDEISIKRIVRKNKQSVYKINGETKTRQSMLALLAQAGIDPYGFNIILQGEIQSLVRMHTDERRKIIEEVSGISVYELGKEKSLKELDKTESRLKEILAILRERTSYLNNLEKERQQALRFKKLEKDVKRCKASLFYQDLAKKKKEREKINWEISEQNKKIDKSKKVIIKIKTAIEDFESNINSINSTIQKSTGLEQEKLNQEIANIRAELAGMRVKFENCESKILEIQKQKKELSHTVKDNELSIRQLQKETPTLEKKQKEVEIKKQELERLEEIRKKFYMAKSELKSIKERIQDKKFLFQNYANESEFLIKQIESISIELFDKKSDTNKLSALKISLTEKKDILESLAKKEINFEKIAYANESEIDKQKELIDKISKMDICPVCRNQITKQHVSLINQKTIPRINFLKNQIKNSDKELGEIYKKKEILKRDVEQISAEILKRESDLIKISNINEKGEQIRNLQKKIEDSKKEIFELEKKRKTLEKNFDANSNVEQKYETVRAEVQEISLRDKKNINSEILFKQRELEHSKISLKQFSRDDADLNEEIIELRKNLDKRENLLKTKREQEEELSKKFQKLISQRDSLQEKIRQNTFELSAKQNNVHNLEQRINDFKIDKARVGAEIENLEIEMLEFPNIEIIKASKEVLAHRLNKIQEILSKIGSVNLRSLEVYDSIKKEYDTIKEKVETISKEKESILKVIHEIDIKKKKVFLQSLSALNEIFSRNFSQLSTKGKVSLELENRKNPFSGGVNILIKVGHGKYLEVKSLSGGEQTLVALSLIFAIQEFKPYSFYILDEIDAALDKRNSERLAHLLKKYMKKGQYIIITHNDEVISSATNIYGISMCDGISKIISLEV